jgi:hypothetical protein
VHRDHPIETSRGELHQEVRVAVPTGRLPPEHILGVVFSPIKIQLKESCMRRKNKPNPVANFFVKPKPKPRPSRKKRVLVGTVGALAFGAVASAIKERGQQ